LNFDSGALFCFGAQGNAESGDASVTSMSWALRGVSNDDDFSPNISFYCGRHFPERLDVKNRDHVTAFVKKSCAAKAKQSLAEVDKSSLATRNETKTRWMKYFRENGEPRKINP